MFGVIGLAVLSGLGCHETHPARMLASSVFSWLHLSFRMATLLADLNTEFQQLLQHPYQHYFLLLFKYCCNQKLMYLLRIIGPHVLLYSLQFNHMMDMLFGQYFNNNSNSEIFNHSTQY